MYRLAGCFGPVDSCPTPDNRVAPTATRPATIPTMTAVAASATSPTTTVCCHDRSAPVLMLQECLASQGILEGRSAQFAVISEPCAVTCSAVTGSAAAAASQFLASQEPGTAPRSLLALTAGFAPGHRLRGHW